MVGQQQVSIILVATDLMPTFHRGNKYSKKSIHHAPDEAKFWVRCVARCLFSRALLHRY